MDTKGIAPTSGKKSPIRYIGLGLAVTLFLFVVKLGVEHTHWGHENELWVFGLLQGSLSPIDLNNPIAILDISALPGGKVDEPTPRKNLQDIIGALAEVKPYPPRAIAVDVNFSPKEHIPASEDDEEFFDFCNSIKENKQIPVFLGVGETKSAPPEARLGNALYQDLAVAIAGNRSDASRIPLWVKGPQSSTELNTLNYALALEYRRSLPRAPKWIRWALDTNVEATGEAPRHDESIEDGTLTYADRLVNYSKLDQMKIDALPPKLSINPESVKQAGPKYSGKLVILGDLSTDLVPVPGRTEDEPGALVLASATYTLIKEPLFEFKWWAGFLLDLIIASIIIVPVAIIRHRNPDDDRVWLGKQAFYVYVAILVVFLVGWKLVSWAGVLWLDFLLVAFAAFLHPKVEHRMDDFLEKRAAKRAAKKQQSQAEKPSAEVQQTPGAKPSTEPQQTPVESGKAVVGIVLILMAASSNVFGQQQSTPVRCEQNVAAIGLELTTPQKKRNQKVGTCYVRQNKRSKWDSLTAPDAKRQYQAGQHLYCDEGCSLLIQFCGIGTRYEVKERHPKWFPVINAYRPPPPINDPNPHNFGRVAHVLIPPSAEGSRRVVTRTGIGQSVGAIIGAIAGGGKGAAIGAVIGPDETVRASGKKAGAKVPNERTGGNTNSTIDSQFLELLRKADDAREEQKYTLAHETYLEAQKLKPTDYRSFEGIGVVFASQSNWTAAEAAFREALKLNPGLIRLKLNLAVVMLKQMEGSRDKSRAEEVEQLLRSISSINPSNEVMYDLFEELFALVEAEPVRVEPVFRRAVSYDPNSERANFRLARVLYQLGRPVEARKYMRRAENYSYYPDLLEVARTYEIYGQYKDAERVLRIVYDWNRADPTVLYHLGSVLVQRRRFDKALEILQKARELDPNAFAPALAYGIAQLETGNLAGAELTLNEASKKVQQQTDGVQRLAYWFAALGDAYQSKGKLAEAIRAYETSLTYNADNFDFQEKLTELRKQYAAKPPSP